MSKILISDSLSTLAKNILESNNIEVENWFNQDNDEYKIFHLFFFLNQNEFFQIRLKFLQELVLGKSFALTPPFS